MGINHCPNCYMPLEVRDVTPCSICGGWPESIARFNPSAEFAEVQLPNGRAIVLCRGCELEEFMVPGGWGFRLVPGMKLPVDGLQRIRLLEEPRLGLDKFCPSCNLRLSFLTVLAGTA